MMRSFRGLLGLALLLAATLAHAQTPVMLRSVQGSPADSASRGEFLAAFRAAMAADTFAIERGGAGGWRAAGAHTNDFRLVDATTAAAWTLELSLGLPAEARPARGGRGGDRDAAGPRGGSSRVRVSRGLVLAVVALSPEAVAADARPVPVRFELFFPQARRVVTPTAALPGGAYAYPWADAGRVAAWAALETLHRHAGLIDDGERAALAPAHRVEP